MIMYCKMGTMVACIMLSIGLAISAELPSGQDLAEVRSLMSGAEMRAKAVPLMEKIGEVRRSASKQEKCELDRRISNALLEVPPTFDNSSVSLGLRTKFVEMMPRFDVLQPDARLWDALANHLSVADYIPSNAFDGKMAEAKEQDERLIVEGKITRPPCHFGYPRTPNMARVQQEKWAAEYWNARLKSYRLALLKKYAPMLAGYLQGQDEEERSQFRRNFTTRARLTAKECRSFFGDVDVGTRKDAK